MRIMKTINSDAYSNLLKFIFNRSEDIEMDYEDFGLLKGLYEDLEE